MVLVKAGGVYRQLLEWPQTRECTGGVLARVLRGFRPVQAVMGHCPILCEQGDPLVKLIGHAALQEGLQEEAPEKWIGSELHEQEQGPENARDHQGGVDPQETSSEHEIEA